MIRYQNSFTDLLWFAAHRDRHSPVVLTVYALLAGYAFYVGYISNPRARSLAHLVAAVGVSVAIVGLLVIVSAILIALAMASRENRTVLTEHTITLTDTGLLEETRFNRTEQKWAGVTRLARTRRHIFVYVSRDAAHVIPRRAFAVACDAFYERLRAGVQRG